MTEEYEGIIQPLKDAKLGMQWTVSTKLAKSSHQRIRIRDDRGSSILICQAVLAPVRRV